MRSLVPVALMVVALGAAGCGGGGSSGGGSSGGGSSPGAVSMKGLRFHPDNVTVKVGEKVTWTNDDNVDHNVTATKGAKFMSQAFGGGKAYSFTPRRAGTISYVCTLHPGMVGKLIVKG
jgi:plastocyanin